MEYIIAFVVLGGLLAAFSYYLGPPVICKIWTSPPPEPKRDTKEMSIKEIWEEVFKDAA